MIFFEIEKNKIPVTVKNRRFFRKISLRLNRQGELVITKPVLFSNKKALTFLHQNEQWIKRAWIRFSQREAIEITEAEWFLLKDDFLIKIKNKVAFFAHKLELYPSEVVISKAKSRWGSCSRSGKLSFSFRLVKMADEIVDYVIVHELCHLREFNHSKQFWSLVKEILPDFQKVRKELKKQL